MTDTRKEFESLFNSGFKDNIGSNTYERMYIAWQACQSLNDKRIENYKSAYETWQDKTEWVQETSTAKELGLHRADVLKKRIEQLLAVIAKKDALINQCIENNLGLADGDICTLKPIKEALALQPADVELSDIGYISEDGMEVFLTMGLPLDSEICGIPVTKLYTIKQKASQP